MTDRLDQVPYEELAVMKGVHVGMRDCAEPVFWFEVELLHGGALQVMSIEQMKIIIKQANVYKLEDLNGKACVCLIKGNTITFDRVKT